MNPLYMLTKGVEAPQIAIFKPKIFTVEDMLEQEVDTVDYEELARKFGTQVENGSKKCWDTLVAMGRRRFFIIKTIYQTAVFRIGAANIKLVNTVFATLDESSPYEEIVSVVEMMLASKKSHSFITFCEEPVEEKYEKYFEAYDNDTLDLDEIMRETKEYSNNYLFKLRECHKITWLYPLYLEYLFEGNKKYKKSKTSIETVKAPSEELSGIVRQLESMMS